MSPAYDRALSKRLALAPASVLVTAELLSAQYAPLLTLEHLSALLGVKRDSILKSISLEDFAIPVTKIGKQWVATAYDVAEFLERNKTRFAA